MDDLSEFSAGVFLVDFEFRPENGREGNTPEPVCLVVKDFLSGVTSRYWKDDIHSRSSAPSRLVAMRFVLHISPAQSWTAF